MRHSTRAFGLAALVFAVAAVSPLGSLALRHGSLVFAPIAQAWSEEVMKFEPVPAESVTAMERRRAERMSRDAERRAAEAGRVAPVAPIPAIPEPSDVPEPPDAPEPPEFSHAGDVVRIGSDIHIEKGQVVEGDVFALRGDILVEGHVKGNVAATGGDVSLGSTARVDGDVMCIGGKLEEEEGARVGGQRVTALRGSEERRLRHRIREGISQGLHEEGRGGWGLGFPLSWLIVTVAAAWGITRLTPDRTGVALAILKREPGSALLFGFLVVVLLIPSLVALVLVMAVLCITIIGIPLAIMLLPAYGCALGLLGLWGFVVGATAIGERVAERVGRPADLSRAAMFGALTLGGLLVASAVLHALPLFGWFAGLVWVLGFVAFGFATMMGAGSLVRSKFGQGPDGRWWPMFKRSGPAEAGAATPPASQSPPQPPPAGPGEPSPAA